LIDKQHFICTIFNYGVIARSLRRSRRCASGAQSVPGCIFTFGEEFGWRGYVQEKFIKNFGLNRGLFLLDAIWGYWHLPIILMGWIYLRSRSIWLPALAHASLNLCATLLFTELAMHQHELFQQLMWIGSPPGVSWQYPA